MSSLFLSGKASENLMKNIYTKRKKWLRFLILKLNLKFRIVMSSLFLSGKVTVNFSKIYQNSYFRGKCNLRKNKW